MAGSETRFVKQEVSHFHGERKEHETDESTARSVFIEYVSLVLLHRRHNTVYLGNLSSIFILLCILNIEKYIFKRDWTMCLLRTPSYRKSSSSCIGVEVADSLAA